MWSGTAPECIVIYPPHACATRVLGLSVCLSLFCHHAQGDNKGAIPIGSALHWLDLKFGDFRMRKLCVKTSEKMNKGLLTSTASARSVYFEGTRSCNEGRASTPA